MKKNQKSKFAIIGYPIQHSLSPAMHNTAFKALKLPFQYSKIQLTPKQLPSFFRKLRNESYLGLNVTVPHKEAVVKFMDELSDEAKLIGAVNTIVIEDSRLKGYNTDGAGYLQSLVKETRLSLRDKRIVILGAGGAARAILASLCTQGVKQITIANRTFSRAKTLAKEFQKKFNKIQLKALPLPDDHIGSLFKETDLLINTTSAELKKMPFPPLPLNHLPRHAIVSDIIYRPKMTVLLKAAKKAGLKTHGGLGMLLYQGALAFELWTGKKAPLSAMKRALEKIV
jgi:shikimate dehydrogenase